MKIKKMYLLAGLVAVILALASCSKSPKHLKLIPDTAPVVMKIDAKKVIDASGAANNEKLKKFIEKNLKDSEMSAEAKKKVEEIVDNPMNAGIDLTQPLFFFVNSMDDNAVPVLVGAVNNRKKFTETFNSLAKESGDEQVKEKGKLSVFANGEGVIFFDDDMFYFCTKNGQDIDKLAKEVEAKFEADEANSMAVNEDMNTINEKPGMIQLLVSGLAMEKMPNTKNAKDALPGLNLKDISYIMDLDMKKGTGTLSYEVLPKSDKWKEFIDKSDKLSVPIKGRFAEYVEKDGMALFANINGKEIMNFIKELGVAKELDKDTFAQVEKVFNAINGDLVISFTGFDMKQKKPELFAYITTEDATLVDMIAGLTGGQAKKQGENKYEMPLDDNYYLDFGKKDNATYLFLGNATSAFAKAKKPFDKNEIKGSGSYFYVSSEFINKFASQMDGQYASSARELINMFDYADMSNAGKGKAAFNIYTKDKDHTLLEQLIDFGLKMAE